MTSVSSERQKLIRRRLDHQDYCCFQCKRRFWKRWRRNNDKPWNYVINFYPNGDVCPILCKACQDEYGDVSSY